MNYNKIMLAVSLLMTLLISVNTYLAIKERVRIRRIREEEDAISKREISEARKTQYENNIY